MTRRDILRIIGGGIVVLIGLVLTFGSLQLWNGAPASRPDIIADATTVRSIARDLLVLAAILLIGGIAATINLGWGQWAATIAIALWVAGGFWANRALFGRVPALHMGAHVLLGALSLWLLWVGYSAHRN
jgi:hypothetical protein